MLKRALRMSPRGVNPAVTLGKMLKGQREKCMWPLAPSVAARPRYLSGPVKTVPFIAALVLRRSEKSNKNPWVR